MQRCGVWVRRHYEALNGLFQDTANGSEVQIGA